MPKTNTQKLARDITKSLQAQGTPLPYNKVYDLVMEASQRNKVVVEQIFADLDYSVSAITGAPYDKEKLTHVRLSDLSSTDGTSFASKDQLYVVGVELARSLYADGLILGCDEDECPGVAHLHPDLESKITLKDLISEYKAGNGEHLKSLLHSAPAQDSAVNNPTQTLDDEALVSWLGSLGLTLGELLRQGKENVFQNTAAKQVYQQLDPKYKQGNLAVPTLTDPVNATTHGPDCEHCSEAIEDAWFEAFHAGKTSSTITRTVNGQSHTATYNIGTSLELALDLSDVYAYPGDYELGTRPLATHWAWQVGGTWMAVEAWEKDTWLNPDDLTESLQVPGDWWREITDVPETGTLCYVNSKNEEVTLNR